MGEAYNILSDRQKRARYDSGQDLEEHGMDFGGSFHFNKFLGKKVWLISFACKNIFAPKRDYLRLKRLFLEINKKSQFRIVD